MDTISLGGLLDDLPELRSIPELCESAELMDSKRHAEALIAYIENGDNELECHQLGILAHAVKWQIFYELQNHVALIIPSHRSNFYKQAGTFLGQKVLDKIDVGEDADEAGNCFALGRYSACVFHLMRIVEKCLLDFGLRAQMPWDRVTEMQWQEIINGIRSKLNLKFPKHKDPARRPFENMLGHIETLKNAWRTPTIHHGVTYTDARAKEIMDAVKSFVQSYVDLMPHLEPFSVLE